MASGARGRATEDNAPDTCKVLCRDLKDQKTWLLCGQKYKRLSKTSRKLEADIQGLDSSLSFMSNVTLTFVSNVQFNFSVHWFPNK